MQLHSIHTQCWTRGPRISSDHIFLVWTERTFALEFSLGIQQAVRPQKRKCVLRFKEKFSIFLKQQQTCHQPFFVHVYASCQNECIVAKV